MDQVTNLLVREEFIDMPVADGQLKPDVGKDILKVAAIERSFGTGRSFVGLIRGIGLKRGAIATSSVWDCGDIMVVGADEADMARAVNRIRELGGGHRGLCRGQDSGRNRPAGGGGNLHRAYGGDSR